MEKNNLDPHLHYSDWILTENYFDPEQLNYKETIFTIGNGYLGTRGSFEEGLPGTEAATFINGLYDDVPIYYTELVNCPDWLPLYIAIDDEEFRLDKGEIFSYQRQLDLKRGIVSRKISWRSPNGKTIDLYFERFASLADEHLALASVECGSSNAPIRLRKYRVEVAYSSTTSTSSSTPASATSTASTSTGTHIA